jgi:hypothetical protein
VERKHLGPRKLLPDRERIKSGSGRYRGRLLAVALTRSRPHRNNWICGRRGTEHHGRRCVHVNEDKANQLEMRSIGGWWCVFASGRRRKASAAPEATPRACRIAGIKHPARPSTFGICCLASDLRPPAPTPPAPPSPYRACFATVVLALRCTTSPDLAV